MLSSVNEFLFLTEINDMEPRDEHHITEAGPPEPKMVGGLPAWGHADLPEPLPMSTRNLLHTIGPGAILLAGSIGGGEWLVGPAIAVQYGTSILWFAVIAIVIQTLFNLEGIRYTLYTGEPILVGIMRLRPNASTWSTIYVLLSFAQLGVPALAAGCASVLFASFAGRLAAPGDNLHWLTYGIILTTVIILLSGKTIERMLEWVAWFMIIMIFTFLLVVNIMFVPLDHWLTTLSGFFQFGSIPEGMGRDIILLGTFAATAGAGGVGNLVITNWVRDKGFGMGAHVGAITSAFSKTEFHISPVGKVFAITADNLRRWRLWWAYVSIDQIVLWGGGCFLGMYLNVNLATWFIAPDADMQGMNAGAIQANAMARQWSGFWFIALLNGFWVLFSTHLSNTDTLVRTVTDTIWGVSSRRLQNQGVSISKLYYLLLAVLTVFGLIAVNWGHAMDLFKVLGFVAGPLMTLASIQIFFVNTTLLPPELRPPLWRRIALIVSAIFFGLLTVAMTYDLVEGLFTQ